MAERPMLMSAPMVRAILDGSKTQTRRVVKPQPREASPGPGIRAALYRPGDFVWPDKVPGCSTISCKPHGPDGWAEENSPYGKPGDRLWVREAWRTAASLDHLSPSAIAARCIDAGYRNPWAPLLYDADGHRNSEWRGFETPPKMSEPGKGRPSIHMPRWASRISLEITRVRVERLQDISGADSRAEGAAGHPDGPWHAYRSLWTLINGPDSWAANPWVWVVEFRRVSP